MANAEFKSFKNPDDVRKFEKGKVELLNIGGGVVGIFILEPGWRWSLHVKQIAKTSLCENAHFYYQLSGHLAVKMADGTQFETAKSDVTTIPPGHDAWVVGDETVVLIDWAGAAHYAEKQK